MTEKELQELIMKFVELEYLSRLKKKELLIKKALHIDFSIWMKKDYPSHIIKAEIQAKYIKSILNYFKNETKQHKIGWSRVSPFISFVRSQESRREVIRDHLINGTYLKQENGALQHFAMNDLINNFDDTLNNIVNNGICVMQGLMTETEFTEYYNKFMETNEETK